MGTKVKVSVRLNSYNYEVVRSIADLMFDGNLSMALDWILTVFRFNTEFDAVCKFFVMKARYENGDRSREVIDAVKGVEPIIKFVTEITET